MPLQLSSTPPSTPAPLTRPPGQPRTGLSQPMWHSPPWGPPPGTLPNHAMHQQSPYGPPTRQHGFSDATGFAQDYHPGIAHHVQSQLAGGPNFGWPRRGSAPAALNPPFALHLRQQQPRPPPGSPPRNNGRRQAESYPGTGAARPLPSCQLPPVLNSRHHLPNP